MDISDPSVVVAACSFVVFMVISFTVTLSMAKSCREKPRQPSPKRVPVPEIVIGDCYEPVIHISMEEIATATGNFSHELLIGGDSFGHVYKGHLHNRDDQVVAIKRLKRNHAMPGLREFRAEVEALCNLRHQNVVPLIGYCVSGGDRFLVYKFMQNGTLRDWLYNPIRRSFSWDKRVKILQDVAQGLWYMHKGLKTPMIHRDINPKNIMLDFEFKACLTSFGLSRTVMTGSHVSTEAIGSIGYMSPEYQEGIMVATTRADVYSFGVTMLETMKRKSPSRRISTKGYADVSIAKWVRSMATKKRHLEMVDPSVPRNGLGRAGVKEWFRIATLCVAKNSRERPTMAQVVDWLKQSYG